MDPSQGGGELKVTHEVREKDNGIRYAYVTIERALSRDSYCVDGFSYKGVHDLPSCVRTYMGDGSGQTWNDDGYKDYLPQDILDEIERQIPLMALMLS